MPKILHVAEILQGGVATVLNELLPSQALRYGPDHVLLLCPQEHIGSLSPRARTSATVQGYHRSGRNFSSLWRLATVYRQVLRRWQPDLVHVHSSFAGTICRCPGLQGNAPLIYSAHGWAFSRDDSKWLRGLYVLIERWLDRRTDAIHAISRHEGDVAIQQGLSPKRMHVIPCGIALDRLVDERKYNDGNGPLRLLFIGRLDRQKGLDWLLDVMAGLPPDKVQLTVVGSAVLKDAERRLQDNLEGVKFVGWVNQDAIDAYLDAADALIVPSRWEGFGLVAAEAMRRAVPVFVSNRGALAEVIGGDEAGIVFDLAQPRKFRSCLLQLDRSVLHAKGLRGRARVIQYYSAEKMNREMEALYASLLRAS